MICPICRDFDFGSLWQSCREEYSCSALFSSADNGCKTCQILKTALESFCETDQPSKTVWHFSLPAILDRKAEREQSLELNVRRLDSSSPPAHLELYRIADDKDRPFPWASFFPERHHISENTRSATSHAWAEAKLARCLVEHKDCESNSQTPPLLPTRVIDVGATAGPGVDTVKVIQTHGAQGRYIALSHCWGDPKLMTTKLTAHTLQAYQVGIPVVSPPRTFQDGVDVTRKLGVRYIRIDSLCIIQEDPGNDSAEDTKLSRQDWMQEAGNMCAVYQCSHITLAAASASGSNIGFFFNSSRTVELTGNIDQRDYRIYARRRPEHHLEGFPLMRRGWVTQETLLPPRTLIFGETELMWRCREVMACQCSSKPHAYAVENEHWRKLPDPSKLATESTNTKLAYLWYDLAQNYLHTALTFETDRLAAFDGIAQYIRPLRTGDYLAGLWSESLGADLLWAVVGGGSKRNLHTKPPRMTPWSSDKWLFPTWSWASIQGRASWTFKNSPKAPPEKAFLIKYVKASSASSGVPGSAPSPEPYKLRLSGILAPSTLLAIRSRSTLSPATSPRASYRYYPDYDNQEQDLGPETKVSCLRAFHSYDASLRHESYESLVLLCVDAAEKLYERIGLLSFGYPTAQYANGDQTFEPAPHWWGDTNFSQPSESVVTVI